MINNTIPTGEVVDPNGSPIHKDVLGNNKYGPSVPYIGLLQNIQRFQGVDGKGMNCALTSTLDLASPNYTNPPNFSDGCVPTRNNGNYTITTDPTQTQDVTPENVFKLRILLKELAELNNISNRFFDLREKHAVDLLENQNNGESSLRLHYLNRRDNAAFSNQISLWVMSILYIFLTFTVGYLYFTGKLETSTQKMVAALPFVIPIGMIVLGYLTIGKYSLFLERS